MTKSTQGSEVERLEVKRAGCGFHTYSVEDYSQFLSVVRELFCDDQDYVWRGCRDTNWHLISNLTRTLRDRQSPEWEKLTSFLTTQHLYTFLLQLRGVDRLSDTHLGLTDALRANLSVKQPFPDVLGSLSKEELRLVFELFSIGQHHGLITPLLDWTRSPHIALYFAFGQPDERPDDVGHRVIYALNRKIVESECPPESPIKNDTIRFIESLALKNPRIIGQAGLFSFSPTHLSIEEWVTQKFKRKAELPVLLRFLIRNKNRHRCLTELAQMNITSRSLYPDIMGAASASNYILERSDLISIR